MFMSSLSIFLISAPRVPRFPSATLAAVLGAQAPAARPCRTGSASGSSSPREETPPPPAAAPAAWPSCCKSGASLPRFTTAPWGENCLCCRPLELSPFLLPRPTLPRLRLVLPLHRWSLEHIPQKTSWPLDRRKRS